MVRKILNYTLFALLFSLQLCSTTIGQETGGATAGDHPREIPFEYVNGHLIEVRGSIGSRTNLPFLVEVGTPRSMLGMEFAGKENGTTAQATELPLKDLFLGTVSIPEFRAYLVDLSQMPAVPKGIAGIIGLDILQRQNVTINFDEKKIIFWAKAGGDHKTPMLINEAGLTVDCYWKESPLKLVLSTGVEAIALDQERVSEKSMRLQRVERSGFGPDQVSGSAFELREMTLSDVKLAGLGVLRKMDWPEGSGQLMGFLPLDALRARQVSFDFEKMFLFWDDMESSSKKARLAGNKARPDRKP